MKKFLPACGMVATMSVVLVVDSAYGDHFTPYVARQTGPRAFAETTAPSESDSVLEGIEVALADDQSADASGAAGAPGELNSTSSITPGEGSVLGVSRTIEEVAAAEITVDGAFGMSEIPGINYAGIPDTPAVRVSGVNEVEFVDIARGDTTAEEDHGSDDDTPDVITDGGDAADREPDRPADPSEPADPATPDDPTEPSEPEEPAEPELPKEPAGPERPADPAVPVTPQNPATPVNPVKPEQPADPSEPADPVTPADPSQPADPADPANPTNPMTGGDPQNPGTGEDRIGEGDDDGETQGASRPKPADDDDEDEELNYRIVLKKVVTDPTDYTRARVYFDVEGLTISQRLLSAQLMDGKKTLVFNYEDDGDGQYYLTIAKSEYQQVEDLKVRVGVADYDVAVDTTVTEQFHDMEERPTPEVHVPQIGVGYYQHNMHDTTMNGDFFAMYLTGQYQSIEKLEMRFWNRKVNGYYYGSAYSAREGKEVEVYVFEIPKGIELYHGMPIDFTIEGTVVDSDGAEQTSTATFHDIVEIYNDRQDPNSGIAKPMPDEMAELVDEDGHYIGKFEGEEDEDEDDTDNEDELGGDDDETTGTSRPKPSDEDEDEDDDDEDDLDDLDDEDEGELGSEGETQGTSRPKPSDEDEDDDEDDLDDLDGEDEDESDDLDGEDEDESDDLGDEDETLSASRPKPSDDDVDEDESDDLDGEDEDDADDEEDAGDPGDEDESDDLDGEDEDESDDLDGEDEDESDDLGDEDETLSATRPKPSDDDVDEDESDDLDGEDEDDADEAGTTDPTAGQIQDPASAPAAGDEDPTNADEEETP